MRLLSALDDFVNTTLAAVPGVLGRLRYLAGLRDSTGEYEHWGLARIHGRQKAMQAMAEAHSEVFLEFLRTPVARLVEEYTEDLSSKDAAAMLPADLHGGSARHFNSILSALSMLAHSRQRHASR